MPKKSNSRSRNLGMKILMVDDDPKLNKLVCTALREAKYRPDPALSLSEARTKLTTKNYNLAIVDWMFDGEAECGVDLVKEIKRDNGIPTLMLTGRSALADRISGFQAGVDDYLVKPFYLPELVARVSALLRRPHRIIQQKFSIGSMALDPSSFELKIHDKKIPLRKKEFQLLLALIEACGETINRTLLSRLVWGEEGTVLSNAIDVHIKSLRERLGKFQGMIETVRGVGYRFDKSFTEKKRTRV